MAPNWYNISLEPGIPSLQKPKGQGTKKVWKETTSDHPYTKIHHTGDTESLDK